MTSAAGQSIDASACHLPSRRRGMMPRGVHRVTMFTSLACVCLFLAAAMGIDRAGAAPVSPSDTNGAGPQLMLIASGSTNVGLQVFANVNLGGGTNPTGTLTFKLFGRTDPTCSSPPVFTSTVAVTGTSVNSDHYMTTAAGTYRWEASYSGDSNNDPVGPTACDDPSAAVIVGKAYSAVALTAESPAGGSIRASVALYGYNPTGSVTFYLTPPGDTFCSTSVFTSTVAVNGNGTYVSVPYVPLVGGLFKWRAVYSGDQNNQYLPMSGCLDPNAAVTAPSPFATFTSPLDAQTNVDMTAPFTWQPAPQAQAYFLIVGTTPGGWDLAWSGMLSAAQSSYSVPALPAGQVYALLYTQVNGVWLGQSISFTAVATEAGLTSPVSGQANVDPNGALTWTTVPGVQGYALWIGTAYGSSNLLSTALLPATQSSITPPPLPPGQRVYIILFTMRNGAWTHQAITITTAGHASSDSGTATKAPSAGAAGPGSLPR